MFAALFAVFGGYAMWAGTGRAPLLFAVAAAFAAVAIVAPRLLQPLNRLWMAIAEVLHRIVNPLVLGVMFFLIITPMGMVMRALGKDPLRRKFNKGLDTYWIARDPPGPADPASFKDQF